MLKNKIRIHLLKTGCNISYPLSLVLTIFAILIKAKVDELAPGFELMKFAFSFFIYCFLLVGTISVLILQFKENLRSKANNKK